MKENIKFYSGVFAVVLAVVGLSVSLFGGYGLLFDCVVFGALAALAD